MIYDLLANIGNYRGIGGHLDRAIAYLMETDLDTLPMGKTEIDGDRVFLQVMEADTHELTDDGYEIHWEYMDIQMDIEGCEVIGIDLDGVSLTGEYKPDYQKAAVYGGCDEMGGAGSAAVGNVGFEERCGKGENGCEVESGCEVGKTCRCIMGPGRFIICMAGEAHAPGGCLKKPGKVKKCVVKVAVDRSVSDNSFPSSAGSLKG